MVHVLLLRPADTCRWVRSNKTTYIIRKDRRTKDSWRGDFSCRLFKIQLPVEQDPGEQSEEDDLYECKHDHSGLRQVESLQRVGIKDP